MRKILIYFLLALCQICTAGTSRDSVYVSKQETDFSDIYTLYYQTNDSLQKIHEINTVDESSIEYQYHYKDGTCNYDCIALYNGSGDCIQYLFLDRYTNNWYITKNCFLQFYVEKQSVNFKDETVILHSDYGNNAEHAIVDISFSDNFIFDGERIKKRLLERIVSYHNKDKPR